MAIEEEKLEVEDYAVLDEGLSAEGADPEFLAFLEELIASINIPGNFRQ